MVADTDGPCRQCGEVCFDLTACQNCEQKVCDFCLDEHWHPGLGWTCRPTAPTKEAVDD